MEPKRPPGERASHRVRVHVALLALSYSVAILASCSGDSYGFSGAPLANGLVLDADAGEIRIQVVLDEGYEAADDFEQKAFLRVNGTTATSMQPSFEEPFVLPVAEGESSGQLELLLGFCHSLKKEVCFVDRAVLAIEREESRSEAPSVVLRYRPQPPQ